LEQLETSFVSLTGGVEEAAAMMEQLNEFTAKTPFQIENVANAARQLIASGTEISQVNEQLQFLGDIAATSGVTIEEIAAIFAKVNAKGKVELENLNQLAERGIPIFKALAEATGLPADKLGAGAVSVEEFNKVLKSFAEEGGFAAGAMERLSQTAAGKFSTALDNLKQAGAEIGNQLLPFISALLDKVTELAQSFAALSDGTKRAILVLGGMAAALGPLLYTLPQVIAIQAVKRCNKLQPNYCSGGCHYRNWHSA
jgi:tape measure domain-containing protein